MSKKMFYLAILIALTVSACGNQSPPVDTIATQVAGTVSAQESATAVIENAVKDMLTSSAPPPSDTPLPATDTPTSAPPTETPTETPTITVVPTNKPIVSYQTSTGDCKNQTGNIQFRNNSGGIATVDLILLEKGRSCTYSIFLISGGSSWFWVEPGKYRMTWSSCHGTTTIDNTLNSGWWYRFKAC